MIADGLQDALADPPDGEGDEFEPARGIEAVRGVSFSVKAGEIVGLAGIDGNGQSELIDALSGLRPVADGTVRLGGRLWYLQGTADTTYNRVFVTDPGPAVGSPPYTEDPIVVEQGYISTNNPFRMLRYGLLLEATYAF